MDGNWLSGILRLQTRHVTVHAVNEHVIGRTKIRSAGVGRVVPVPCRRWPRVQVAWSCECLSDDSRSDDFAVPDDKLPISFVAEQYLSQERHHQRIDNA